MWCLTCSSFAQLDSEAHSCIDMSSVSLKNFEALLTLRNDLRKKVEEGQNKLAEAIEKREVQDYLSQVSKALKLFITEVDGLEEENNLHLTELISLLEGGQTLSTQDEPCLSEFVSLFDDCATQDTIETLREKLDWKYQSQYDGKLTATDLFYAELEKQKKTKITVSLLDESNNPFAFLDSLKSLRDGFTINWPVDNSQSSSQKDLLVLSHVIFAINNKRTQFASETVSSTSSHFLSLENQLKAPATIQPTRLIASTTAVTPKFLFYVFNCKQPFGQLTIEPLSSYSSFPFNKILGDYCRFYSLGSFCILKVFKSSKSVVIVYCE